MRISLITSALVFGLTACSGYDLQNIPQNDLVVAPTTDGTNTGGGGTTTTTGGGGGGGTTGGGTTGGTTGGGTTGTTTGGGTTSTGCDKVVVTDGTQTGKTYCKSEDPIESDGNNRVMICHVPEGNPDAAHTLLVSINGWTHGHQAHHPLDYLGPCHSGPTVNCPPADTSTTITPMAAAEGQCYKACE